MPMSRSRGDFWLATSPSMRSSPSEMSSSPAIMLSVVDLPQPDGPTRITNSPSGNRLVTWSRTISAMGTPSLALDRARRQAGNDPALEQEDDDDDGDGDDDGRGRDRPGRLLELRRTGEEGQSRRHRAGVVGRCERDGEHEVVPAVEEHKDRRGEDARGGQRNDDPPEGLERRGAVERRGPL